MTDFMNTGVSGLLAFQRALATTSHNIVNSNTVGFSRQQALFVARPGIGTNASGVGTEVGSVRRIYDQYLVAQVQSNTSAFSRLESFHSLSAQVNDLLAAGGNDIGMKMQDFFNALDAVANDPSSLVTREALLGQANAMASDFERADNRLNALDLDVNTRIQNSISDINALANSIASINNQIVTSGGVGRVSGDLLDQRDALLGELHKKVSVSTVQQGDGSLSVFIGNGLALVRASGAEQLEIRRNEYDPTRIGIGIRNGPDMTSRLSGGEIGGALDFRREVLDPTRNTLGRLANGLAFTINEQHRKGADLLGMQGGNLFAVGSPVAQGSSQNAGTAVASVAITDISALTTDDYLLRFDGATWSLAQSDTGVGVAMTGSGTAADPFLVNGISIEVSAGAVAGDRFLVRPNGNAAAGMEVLINDPAKIAAAAAIISTQSTSNTGAAQVTVGEVMDSENPNLLVPLDITFIDSSNYTIGGSGPFAYTDGAPIDFNGWRVEITGAPNAGDTFSIGPTTAGAADNRNALMLSDLQSIRILDNGTSGMNDSFGTLVASVGTVTQHAGISRDAQGILLADSEQARLSVSGVNLDEEAANLMRFEQAYQAAAQVISVSDQLFQTLIGAVGR